VPKNIVAHGFVLWWPDMCRRMHTILHSPCDMLVTQWTKLKPLVTFVLCMICSCSVCRRTEVFVLHRSYLSTARLTKLGSGELLRVYDWCKRQYKSSCTILQKLWVSIMSLNSKLWIVGAPQKLWYRWGRFQWTSTHHCTIHPSWCTGRCWFTVASEARSQLLLSCVMILNGKKKGNVFMVFIPHDCEPCHMNLHETWFCRCFLCECVLWSGGEAHTMI
jgi:hypothetical protein